MELERPLAAQIANPNQNSPYRSWGVTLAIGNPKQSPSRRPCSFPASLRTPFVAAQNNSTPVNRGTVFLKVPRSRFCAGPPEIAFHPGYPKEKYREDGRSYSRRVTARETIYSDTGTTSDRRARGVSRLNCRIL